MVWGQCFYVGGSLCRLSGSSVFGVGAGFGMDANHIFPRGVLAIILLIRGVAGVTSRACAGCKAGLPLCSIAVTTLSGAGSAPS